MEDFKFEYYKPCPDKPGYVTHDKFCTYKEFHDALQEYLTSIKFDDEYTMMDQIDYISYMSEGQKEYKKEIPNWRWLYCYICKGGSEGYYFHIDSIESDGKWHQLLLLKTLREDTEVALRINNEINRFILKTL